MAKKALCWALLGMVYDHKADHLRLMAVTSVKRNKHGELVMLYGRNESGIQTSYSMQTFGSPRFYMTEEAALDARSRAVNLTPVVGAQVERAEREYQEQTRIAKLAIERALGTHEIQIEEFI